MKENQAVLNYMCAYFNWIEQIQIQADRWNYSLQSRRICSIATRDDETERDWWRVKDERRASFQVRGRRGQSLLASEMVA